MVKIFISHASEDKESFVRPFVEAISKSFDVWYDENDLYVGDSLLQAIQGGLVKSDYGVIVLSKSFFQKKWTKAELDGLFTLEMSTGKKILPIWLDLSFDEIASHSPILAGRLAVNSSVGMDGVVNQIKAAILRERAEHIQKPEYQVTLSNMRSKNEFLTPDGSLMKHTNDFVITALTDGVSNYTEQFQSDGIIHDFAVSPGEITQRRNEESIIYLDTSFGKELNKGESIKRTLSCIYSNSFMGTSEYWVFRQSNPTKDIEIEFVFPKERHPKKWNTVVRKLNYDEKSYYEAVSKILDDGRMVLLWNIPELGAQSAYKLTWEW